MASPELCRSLSTLGSDVPDGLQQEGRLRRLHYHSPYTFTKQLKKKYLLLLVLLVLVLVLVLVLLVLTLVLRASFQLADDAGVGDPPEPQSRQQAGWLRLGLRGPRETGVETGRVDYVFKSIKSLSLKFS